MFSNAKYDTADGGTVEFTRVGIEFDLHYRNAAGYTCATVRMNEDTAWHLAAQLDDEFDMRGKGYDDGYANGFADAGEAA